MSEKLKKYSFWICIFIGLFIFFSRIHPLYLFDADDWTYISERRFGLPLWGWWNPAKVLPETLMSYTGDLGVWVIKRFVGDYVTSLMLACALVYSFMITMYFRAMSAVMEVKLGLKGSENGFLTILMVLFHFLVFKKMPDGNAHFFYASNVTCIFNYVIPALLCAILVMYLIRTDLKKLNAVQVGFLLLATYLCVFSNLFDSVILVSYAGFCLLRALFAEARRSGGKLSTKRQDSNGSVIRKAASFIKEQAYYFVVIAFFLIQCIYELSGGRASGAGGGLQLGETVISYLTWPRRFNLMFLLMAVGLVVFFTCYRVFFMRRNLGRVVYAAEKQIQNQESAATDPKTAEITEKISNIPETGTDRKELSDERDLNDGIRNLLFITISSFALTSLALIALCSAVSASYMARTDVIIAAIFYLFLMLMSMAAYLLRKLPVLFLAVPLVCFVTLTIVTSGLRIFAESNMKKLPGREVLAIDRDLVRQIVEASAAGKTEMKLHVPQWDSEDNWPHATYLGTRMAKTLYRHGMTNHLMTITVVPDASYEPMKE